MVATTGRQSREQLEADDRRRFGDTRPKPGKALKAPSLSADELVTLKLRITETREVAVLGAMVAAYPSELRDAVESLVKAVDRINRWLAGIAQPRGDEKDGDPFAPDFSGLTCDALRGKRATLCLAAKRATVEAEAGRIAIAVQVINEAMAVCYKSGGGP